MVETTSIIGSSIATSGVMSAGDALSGLANEGVVTIAAMFAVAAGLKETGALRWLSYKIMGTPKSLTSAQNRIMWPTATISAFMNNTPLVAMLLPIIDEWSKQHRLSASKLLMPLSFASILGGTCTLIGTSTNLVVNGWIIEELNHPGLGMFEITINVQVLPSIEANDNGINNFEADKRCCFDHSSINGSSSV